MNYDCMLKIRLYTLCIIAGKQLSRFCSENALFTKHVVSRTDNILSRTSLESQQMMPNNKYRMKVNALLFFSSTLSY